jgi:hypothetical protein
MHNIISGKKAIEKKRADYSLGEQYFQKYLIPIDIRTLGLNFAVEIQRKIPSRELSIADLSMSHIHDQFHDLLEADKRMFHETGLHLDFYGFKGLVFDGRNRVSNVLVTKEDRLVIVDFATMHIEPAWHEWPIWFFIEWAKKRQAALIHRHWIPSLRGIRTT